MRGIPTPYQAILDLREHGPAAFGLCLNLAWTSPANRPPRHSLVLRLLGPGSRWEVGAGRVETGVGWVGGGGGLAWGTIYRGSDRTVTGRGLS